MAPHLLEHFLGPRRHRVGREELVVFPIRVPFHDSELLTEQCGGVQ